MIEGCEFEELDAILDIERTKALQEIVVYERI